MIIGPALGILAEGLQFLPIAPAFGSVKNGAQAIRRSAIIIPLKESFSLHPDLILRPWLFMDGPSKKEEIHAVRFGVIGPKIHSFSAL